ncbi:thiamine pyrophosphate-dependent enzyme [uncultured Helicobacter sp.]|uniref:thiamine pyrophosphate-dependent enzyme n=2 Tax=uncultured Helicobacter sp. TaxID=175537 RepID=UPI00374EE8D3
MLDTYAFGEVLEENGFRDFSGVPCSYLAPLINYAINEGRFVMANNEGEAVAIASGVSLAGNSSLGNHSVDFGNFGAVITDEVTPTPKLPKNSQSNTANTRILSASHSINSETISEYQEAKPRVESQENLKPRHIERSEISTESINMESSANLESKVDSESSFTKSDFTHREPHKILASCDDFVGYQVRGAGSLLDINDQAECEHSAKSAQKTSQDSKLSAKSKKHTFGVVLMQNSGLSNALSPLTSLNHTFGIPILGFVSLRGDRDEQGRNTDEPQHELLGVITDKLLETCEVAYAFLSADFDEAKKQVRHAREVLESHKSFFFIVRDKTFSKVALDTRISGKPRAECRANSEFNVGLESSFTDSKIITESTTLQNLDSQKSEFAHTEPHKNPSLPIKELESGEVFFDDFKSYQVRGTGSYLSGNDQAERADSLKGAKKTSQEKTRELSGSILDEKSGLCSRERGDKTRASIDEVSDKLPDLSLKDNATLPTRLQALETIHTIATDSQSVLLATTGKCGRELYELGDRDNQLYMVGSMGCVGALGLGIALKNDKKVMVIDGDSALLMRLGALSTNAYYAKMRDMGNFCHILLDNESHDSTGGQFNLSPFVDFCAIARACGYECVYHMCDVGELGEALRAFVRCKSGGAWFVYLRIAKGSKEPLGRPKITPKQVAMRLRGFLAR